MRKLDSVTVGALPLLPLVFGVFGVFGAGCARSGPVVQSPARASNDVAIIAGDGRAIEPADRPRSNPNATWIGASAEGELLSASTRETFLGVWVDVPETPAAARPPMEVVLVVDTSGSMAGSKIESARAAATTLVRSLKDGDMVALDTFSDEAHTLVPPTVVDAFTRPSILRQIAGLVPSGSTNMFSGLNLAESQMAGAPATHTLRRVVMISDGIANVGPSSPEVLGSVAERGLRNRAQVTSFGIGTDYDERTLNALSVRSNGRLFHIGEPREMQAVLKNELALLDQTVASDSFVEIMPAPGVQLLGADGLRTEVRDGALRIPLGALHSGQHREALVRVRITDPQAFEGRSQPLASVRLRFRDAAENDLERVQEVVARTQLTSDEGAVARTVSSRTKSIVAIMDASKTQMEAAQRINDGDFAQADKALAKAQQTLSQQAAAAAPVERKRLEAAVGRVVAARAATQAMPSKTKDAQRNGALDLNADAMHSQGF